MYRDIQQSVQFLNRKLLKGTICLYNMYKKWLELTQNNNYWSKKFMIAQRLVMSLCQKTVL